MTYLKKEKSVIKFPYLLKELAVDFPNTSFPENLSEKTLNEFGVYSVTEKAVIKNPSKKYVLGTPVLVNGIYEVGYIEQDLTSEELSQKVQRELESIRNIRNSKLRECDYVMLSDSPYKNDLKPWTDYRQALRDITNQADIFNVVWPVKPTEI